MQIVLASASPRRRELLTMLGVKDFKIIPAEGEEIIVEGMTPYDAVCALSKTKAEEVSKKCNDEELLIAADTVVSIDCKILGKPSSQEEAKKMLSILSGRDHIVYTGVTVMQGEKCFTEFESTVVTFRELSEREIDAYIKTGEPMDKAGAYGAQGIGSLFVEGIKGDFFNVMGLPLCRLSKMLKKLGVELL